MAQFVAKLVEKNLAYRTEDGSYYFRIAGFPQYGKLSKKDFGGMLDGARVDIDEYDKDSARDFVVVESTRAGRGFLGFTDRAGATRVASGVFGDARWRSWVRRSICTPVEKI